MKITIEIPDTTVCAFLNYVFLKGNSYLMGVRQISSENLYDGAIIVEEKEEVES